MNTKQTQCPCGITLHWRADDEEQQRCVMCGMLRDNPFFAAPLIDAAMRTEIERHLQAITGGMAYRAVALARFHAILAGEGLPPNVIEHEIKKWMDARTALKGKRASMEQQRATEGREAAE